MYIFWLLITTRITLGSSYRFYLDGEIVEGLEIFFISLIITIIEKICLRENKNRFVCINAREKKLQ